MSAERNSLYSICDRDCLVEKCDKIGEDIFLMTLKNDEIARDARPGQFVAVRPSPSLDPLLRRPLAIAGTEKGSFQLCFRVVGRGTDLLSKNRPGDVLSVRGPIGNGFPFPGTKKLILVAGTLGVAPLFFAKQLYEKERNIDFIVGVPGRDWSSFCQWLNDMYPQTVICSDDGSIGIKGTVLEGLKKFDTNDCEVWACGPTGMLKALSIKFSGSPDGNLWVSLEKRMACGMGGCHGCVIQTTSGQQRVCVDGPVFNGREVLWDELR